MFIWADNLADSRVLILGNLKPHNGRLSTEGPFAFATRIGRQRWKVDLAPTTREAAGSHSASASFSPGRRPDSLKHRGWGQRSQVSQHWTVPPHEAGCYTTALKVLRGSGVLAAATGTTLAEGFPRPGWEAHHWLRPHTGSVATSVSGEQLLREEGQTQGCCALHSNIWHFRRLQTRLVRTIWLRPHGGTRRKGCTGQEAAGRKEWRYADGTERPFTDNCLCKQFYYPWKPHALTEGLNLGTGYSSHLYASAHTALGTAEDREVELTVCLKGKFSSCSADYGWILFQGREWDSLTKVLCSERVPR